MPRPKGTAATPAKRADRQLEPDMPEIRYLAALLTQTNLPYKDPGQLPQWVRRNGGVSLSVHPGLVQLPDGTMGLRYPYGTMPRLILIWLTSSALATGTNTLELGSSLTEFMAELGLKPTGGPRGSITRLKSQMDRLLRARLVLEVTTDYRNQFAQMQIATSFSISRSPEGGPSLITLDKEFFQEIIRRPVPLNMATLAALRGSAMRLDIYSWLTWRMYKLHRPTVITWDSLMLQFGSNFADTKQGRSQFRSDFSAHLERVLKEYTEARAVASEAGLKLFPSKTSVPRQLVLPGLEKALRSATTA